IRNLFAPVNLTALTIPPATFSKSGRYRRDFVRQLREAADHAVGRKIRNGSVAVTEIDGDHRNTGGARRANIGFGIADHDRVSGRAARSGDRAPQDVGIRLLDAERVLAADRGEAS